MGATADDVPATERVSKHAAGLESLDARGILTALGNCDKELYASESSCGQPGISHRKILNDVGELADVVSELLRRSLTDAKATAATAEPPGAVDTTRRRGEREDRDRYGPDGHRRQVRRIRLRAIRLGARSRPGFRGG